MSEAMRISFPDGTKKRIAALGIPGGAPDFIRWAVESVLQEQEHQQKRPEAIPSSYPEVMAEAADESAWARLYGKMGE